MGSPGPVGEGGWDIAALFVGAEHAIAGRICVLLEAVIMVAVEANFVWRAPAKVGCELDR